MRAAAAEALLERGARGHEVRHQVPVALLDELQRRAVRAGDRGVGAGLDELLHHCGSARILADEACNLVQARLAEPAADPHQFRAYVCEAVHAAKEIT